MWVDRFQRFLDRSLQQVGLWARGIVCLRARFVRLCIDEIGKSMPERQRVADILPPLAEGTLQSDWHLDLTYDYRSLECKVRLCAAEPTPGMKLIYRALQESTEAQLADPWRQ